MVGNSPGQKSFACAGRSVEKHSLRLGDAEGIEQLRVLDGQLDDLFNLLDLSIETSNIFVRRVGHLLDHHEADERVDLVGQNLVQGVAVASQGDTAVRSDVRDVDVLVYVHDKFSLWVDLKI